MQWPFFLCQAYFRVSSVVHMMRKTCVCVGVCCCMCVCDCAMLFVLVFVLLCVSVCLLVIAFVFAIPLCFLRCVCVCVCVGVCRLWGNITRGAPSGVLHARAFVCACCIVGVFSQGYDTVSLYFGWLRACGRVAGGTRGQGPSWLDLC